MSDLVAMVCPFCGAPLKELVDGACPFCRTVLTSGSGAAAPVPNRPTGGTVWVHDCGRKKIAVIKVLREYTGLGLKEAKDLADGVVPGQPVVVAQGLAPDRAAAFAEALRRAGALADAG